MGWSKHHKNGLIYYSPQKCSQGYTLVTPTGGNFVNLIDMEGRVCHRWQSEDDIGYAYLLPDGHLLLRTGGARQGGQQVEGGARSGAIRELDWEGELVWEYRNPMIHHDFERLANGNTLVLLFGPLAADLVSQIKGGSHSGKAGEEMLGDLVQEITPKGEIVYSWRSWDHLDPEDNIICQLENREEWTHQNSLNVTSDGDLLVSFRRTDTVGIIKKDTGDFSWKWGPGVISHQHHPTYLDNGHVLLFDNGCHRPGPTFSRVIEVDPATNEIAWEYQGDPSISFYSFHISGAERLANGNTLICEGAPGRIFEVTPDQEIVWEYVNPMAGRTVARGMPNTPFSVFRAHRYGPDHPGLQGKELDPGKYAELNRKNAGG